MPRRAATMLPGASQARPPRGLDMATELGFRERAFRHIAGVDEVGRGPLAGPVTAAAVILDSRAVPDGLMDSKQMSAGERVEVFAEIASRAIAIGVGFATAAEIDTVNIRQATFLAMKRALAALPVVPCFLLVDGRDLPQGWGERAEAIVKGDATCASIAAASIVAKVMRDRMMVRLHGREGRYGFDQHKGYATAQHRDALTRFGPSPYHRASFSPCTPGVHPATADTDP